MYDRTLCPNQSGDISNDKIFTLPQKRYESIDTFATKSQLNRTSESLNQITIFNNPILESQQNQENLSDKINQITLNDSANIEQALNSLKFSHPLSASRKCDKEVSVNNLPKNLPNNLPTNQQVSLRDTLEIVLTSLSRWIL